MPLVKREGTVAFPAVPDHLTPNLFPCCFHALIHLPLWDRSPDTHTHTGQERCSELQFYVVCVIYGGPGLSFQPFFPFLRSASKLLSPFLSFHLNSSSINPLHSPPDSPLLLFELNLFNTPLPLPSNLPHPLILSHPTSTLHPLLYLPSSFVPRFLPLLAASLR